MKSPLAFVLMNLALTGCTGPVIMGGDAAVIALTRPSQPPGPDLADQIPQHASWCYRTMGNSQCYAHPQDVPADRLVNVEPQSLYPVDLAAYQLALHPPPPPPLVPIAVVTEPAQTVIVEQPLPPRAVVVAPATATPSVVVSPPSSVEAEKVSLQDEIAPVDAPPTLLVNPPATIR